MSRLKIMSNFTLCSSIDAILYIYMRPFQQEIRKTNIRNSQSWWISSFSERWEVSDPCSKLAEQGAGFKTLLTLKLLRECVSFGSSRSRVFLYFSMNMLLRRQVLLCDRWEAWDSPDKTGVLVTICTKARAYVGCSPSFPSLPRPLPFLLVWLCQPGSKQAVSI